MALEGDKWRTVYAMIIARCWKDPDYRRHFMADPRAVLAAEGIDLPHNVVLKVVEETPTARYVSLYLPHGDADIAARPNAAVQFLERIAPIPPGVEVRLVQSTEDYRYLILPVPPSGVVTELRSEEQLAAVARGFEAVVSETTEAVVAESTEAVVTQTSEAADAETTVEVVAEVALVAT